MDSQNFPFKHFLEKTDGAMLVNSTTSKKEEAEKESCAPAGDHFSADELHIFTQNILDNIKETIGPSKYKAYFESTFKLISFDEKGAVFAVTTPFIKTMIEKHYSAYVTNALNKVLGKETKFSVKIENQNFRSLSSNSENILNSINQLEKSELDQKQSFQTAKDASFTLDLNPSKDDLINTIESKYMDHMGDSHVGINTTKTFDNFVVGPSNHMAYSSAIAIAEGPGKNYPSTYFYSSSGLGKTHLLHAIANRIREHFPHLKIYITTAREFMTEMINALQSNKITAFRKKYSESIDVLMIDDIQELKNKQSTQNEFFHVFNELHQKGKQLIFTSDQDPKEIAGIEERIKTRLSWGLVSDIQKPDIETRIAILKKKAQQEDIYLPDDVINLIACAYQNNIRELEGSLIRLGAYSSLFGVDIDIEIAKQQLRLSPEQDTAIITIDMVAKCTSQYFKIPVADLRSKARYKEVTLARHMAMYLSYKKTDSTYEEVGHFFGHRDHSSVLHAVEKITEKLKTDTSVSEALLSIEGLLA